MGRAQNELALQIVAEVGGVDLSSIKKATKTLETEFYKNLELKINKSNMENVKNQYKDLLTTAISLQTQLNKAFKGGDIMQANEFLNQLNIVSAAMDKIKGKLNGKSYADMLYDDESLAKQEKFNKTQAQVNNIINKTTKEAANARKQSSSAINEESSSLQKNTNEVKKNTVAKEQNKQETKENTGFFSQFMKGVKEGSGILAGAAIGYQAVSMAIQAVRQAAREAFNTIKELNSVMVNVQMVTGDTAEETYKLFNQYNDMAKQLGVTTKSVAEGADQWLRQGKTAEETAELLRVSTMQSKIANIEASKSTELLTSTLNGYKMEAKDAMHVLDALSAVDLAAATSVEEMAVALQKTANTARDAGVQFETLIGYTAAISEATRQAPEIIGTSLKTLFSRMENVKAGKSIDEYGESLNDVEKVINRFGVRLRDSTYQFRNMEDVIDDIANKWTTLTNVERSQIATAVAGVRQREIFIALMDNYGKAIEYNTIALESDGKALEKYNVYLDGVEASLNELKATWEEFVYSEETVQMVKDLISLANALLKVFQVVAKLYDLQYKGFRELRKGISSILGDTGIDGINNKISELEEQKGLIKSIFGEDANDYLKSVNSQISDLIDKKEKLSSEDKSKDLAKKYNLSSKSNLPSIRPDPVTNVANDFANNNDSVTKNINIYKELDDLSKTRLLSNEELKKMTDAKKFLVELAEDGVFVLTDKTNKYYDSVKRASDFVEDNFTETVKNSGSAIDSTSVQMLSYADATRVAYEQLSILDENCADVVLAYKDMVNNGNISIETAKKLADKYDDASDAITYQNGVLKVNVDWLRTKAKEEINTYKSSSEYIKAWIGLLSEEAQAAIAAAQAEAALLTIRSHNDSDDAKAEQRLAKKLEKYQSLITEARKQIDPMIDSLFSSYDPFKEIDNAASRKSEDNAKQEAEKKAKAYVDAIKNQLDSEIKILEANKDKWSEYYDEKINGIKEVQDELDEQERTESKLLEIEKKKAELAKANQEVVRIYRKDQGFVYEKNIEVVNKAQQELDELLKEWDRYQKGLELEEQIKDFEDAKDKTIADINEEIEKLKDLKDQWSDALDISKNADEYASMLDQIKDFENASYSERLDLLEQFQKDWNKVVGGFNYGSGGSSSSSGTELPSGGKNDKWDGITNSGGSWYNPDYYTKDEAEKLEKERRGYASGTMSAPSTGLHAVGENGRELQLVNKGDTIYRHNVAENLMSWGQESPMSFLSKISPKFTSASGGLTNYNFSFDKLVLDGVQDANKFINDLKDKAMSIAIQVSSQRS